MTENIVIFGEPSVILTTEELREVDTSTLRRFKPTSKIHSYIYSSTTGHCEDGIVNLYTVLQMLVQLLRKFRWKKDLYRYYQVRCLILVFFFAEKNANSFL